VAGILVVYQMLKEPPRHELLAICNEAYTTFDSYCRTVEQTEVFSRQRSDAQRISDDPAELARFAWQQAMQQISTGVDSNQERKQWLQNELNESGARAEALARLQGLRESLVVLEGRSKSFRIAHDQVRSMLESQESFIIRTSQPSRAQGMLEYYYDFYMQKTINVISYAATVERITALPERGDQELWQQELETSRHLTEKGKAWLESEQGSE
jgi:hypothetical protein